MKSGGNRISRQEALAFLLTHMVIEKAYTFELNQNTLFTLTSLATEAENRINTEEGVIPHEVIEEIAARFMEPEDRDA